MIILIIKDEFVTSLAALCLYDGEAEITAANISTLLAASNNVVTGSQKGADVGSSDLGLTVVQAQSGQTGHEFVLYY